jgi:hypothetical protein
MNEEEKKKLKDLQDRIRSGKIKVLPAEQDEIKLLDNWVRQVLVAIAEERDHPPIAGAFVSDLSHIGDFYSSRDFPNEEDAEASMRRVADSLNVTMNDIKEDGYIVNMARRLEAAKYLRE